MDNQGNPFAEILAKIAQRKKSEQQAPPPAVAPVTQGEDQPENQLRPGEGAGNTQYLLGALQQIQKYITQEDDPANISIGRGLMTLLTKLIQKEQMELTNKIPEDQAMMQAAPQNNPTE